jgi:hypothetical protein
MSVRTVENTVLGAVRVPRLALLLLKLSCRVPFRACMASPRSGGAQGEALAEPLAIVLYGGLHVGIGTL